MEERNPEHGALNLGCDELLLDPDKLSRLLYEDEQGEKHHGRESFEGENGDMYRHIRDSDRTESNFSDLNNEEERVIHVRKVLPAPNSEDNNVTTAKERFEEEEKSDETGARLPPVRLHKVQSEDLTWLDTIIKHNSLDHAALDSVPETGYLVIIVRIEAH